MIIKKRTTPIDIAKLEAAIPRLPVSYRNRLEKQLVIRHKGYNGELKVDRYTEAMLAHNFTILHDVYLYNKGCSFQIDTLIIGSHCIFVVEIKDYSGTILFNFTTNQFTRIFNHSETSFRNPIIQSTTNKHQLTQWLEAHNFTSIPIFSLVAIADPGTILKIFPEDFDISNVVMHGEYLPHRIMKIDEEFSKEKRLLHQKIGAVILKNCEVFNSDFIIESGIDPRHLQ
ncbi:nuclease-related domain-containing protein [Virgibacillus flavescens]|uniref:nuclease-related domain-containing protein n=1 Tax=Virgibacillus flavescens TaxID=1611422 RepID=UPI003D328F0D